MVLAAGNLGIRGTLAVSKEGQVGFKKTLFRFELDNDTLQEKASDLHRLNERYYTVYQTLKASPEIRVSGLDTPGR